MHTTQSSIAPLMLTDHRLTDALYYRHESPSGTFDAICLPATPEVPAHRLYTDSLPKEKALMARAGEVAAFMGATHMYIPPVFTMTGRIGSRCEFRGGGIIETPSRIPFYRSLEPEAHMEGPPLDPGEGTMFAFGGCGLAVGGGCGAHFGGASLVDRSVLLGNGPSRRSFSVVDEMGDYAELQGRQLEHELFSALFALPAASFRHPLDDPEHGEFNHLLYEYAHDMDPAAAYIKDNYLHVDIGVLAVAQARRRGFGETREICTLPKDGAFAYTRHTDPEMQLLRNPTFVVRRE